MSQTARAVVRGPLHVFCEVDASLEEVIGYPVLGLPFCEAFSDPGATSHGLLLDWARANQEPLAFISAPPPTERGIVTVIPLPGDRLEVLWEPSSARWNEAPSNPPVIAVAPRRG